MSSQWKSPAVAGLAASFGLLLLSLPVFAQTTSIEGIVKDPDGKPLQGAIVKIDRTDVKGSYPVKTDKKGHYGHYGLPLGVFDVSVVVDGQVKDLERGVRPTLSMPATVNFELKATQAAAPGAPAPPADKGMSKEQKEQYEQASKVREAQIAKNKELNDSFQAGRQALEAKMYDQAIENFLKASTVDDKQVAVWSNLADAYVGAAGQKPAEAAALYDKAFDAFRKAIELQPADAAYYNNFALALAKDKKFDDAKANLDKAVQLDPPGAGKYYYNMGALLVNSSQNDAACDAFKKATEGDPKYADAQYQYGVCLAAKATADSSGKIVAAPGTIEALQNYLNLSPDGSFAGAAKELISQLGGTVNTKFSNPNAPATNKKK
jgi:tetratricopeptide (TPR) repeat protein